MNLNVNSIFQSKLNEIQSRIPNITEKSSNFAECLQKITESNSETTVTETNTNTSNSTNVDSLALLSLLSNNSIYNTSSLFSDNSTNTNSLSDLSTLLALQQYKNIN